jgi:hypothetical protein
MMSKCVARLHEHLGVPSLPAQMMRIAEGLIDPHPRLEPAREDGDWTVDGEHAPLDIMPCDDLRGEVQVRVREGGEHGERWWGRWQSARTGAGEEFAGTFSAAVGVSELPMAKGQKRSAKEAKKPKANKPKTSVSDYKKSVIASGHK